MAAEFFRKLFGRASKTGSGSFFRSVPKKEPDPVLEAARNDLARLATERPTLAGPARVLGELLPRLFAEPVRETAPALPAEQAAAKLAGGLPLLRGESFLMDAASFRRRWAALCRVVQENQEGPAAPALADALHRGALDPQQLTLECLACRPEAIHARADALGLDAALTATVLRLTLFPVLTQVGAALAPLRHGGCWQQGYCPTCGSWPLLGEFRGLEQTRWLRCGLCAGEWEFPRLRCPFCAVADHRQLGYFHVEGEQGKFRAATCDGCRGYVKMISTLAALPPPQLLVADVATMYLDLAAAERGYAPGGGPAPEV